KTMLWVEVIRRGSHRSQAAEQREKIVWIHVLPIPTGRQLAHLLFEDVLVMNQGCDAFFVELNSFELHMSKTVHHVQAHVKLKQADGEKASHPQGSKGGLY
ncbi:MAG TPA: hypothetical protein VFN02_12345, partial [Ktedonobacteraceae bacterium]|nr:hypothetical protein [Ktedonobacteraceae bacterium]